VYNKNGSSSTISNWLFPNETFWIFGMTRFMIDSEEKKKKGERKWEMQMFRMWKQFRKLFFYKFTTELMLQLH
jgi:hypothetical protein